MKKTTKNLLLIFCLYFLANNLIYAQNFVPFNVKYNSSLKGDILQIGNGILNRNLAPDTPNNPYNGTLNNNNFNMGYIDIDGDTSTFSSSSADLTIPTATSNCYRIAYAALYWNGMYLQTNVDNNSVNRANLNRVKLKTPGGAYQNITGTLIYDSFPTPLSASSIGYTAFADVTTILQGLPNANGTYTVADVIAGSGVNLAAGWSLFIVYEDPLATAKNITTFDGFSAVNGSTTLNIPITGFATIPVGPVRSKIAFASLEGDLGLTGDRFRVNGTNMTIPTRPAGNFFNSTINNIGGAFTTRVPNSSNLLGFDAGIFNVPNPGNALINNGATNATLSLVTTGDAYFYYFNAFAIEIIQPQINLIKTVRDLSNTNIGNGNVTLGQELYYDLNFQNIGNDNATNFTISDVLPINVDFLPADLVLPPGVTYTFNAATNTLVFTIPNSLVTQGGALYQIRIKVKVVDDCNSLRDACSNRIQNQAYKTYSSQNSGNVVENQQPSASGLSTCLIPEPGTTNFLVGIDDCAFSRDEILCGNSVVLTAASGYSNYQWHSGSPPTAANIISGATNQTYTVSTIGTYSVVNNAPAPCLSINETINVIDFNGVVPNPILPYADEVVNCTNLGSQLPKIFLCGASDSQLLETNILNATSIIWERLVDASCPPSAIANCPNVNSLCTWNQVGTGPNYNVTTAGQYRLRIVFQNGCFRTYYFNVFQNLFTPTETHTDIICNTNGSITINGVPSSGYEFSINGPAGPWQSSNVFSIATAGNYTVLVRQISAGVGNCVFTIPNIPIRVRNFTVNVIPSQPLCNGSLGSIRVQVNDVLPQYTYQLFLGATLVNSAGPINANDYTFPNLNPGTYTVIASTTDGCTNTQTVTLTAPPVLTVSAAITIPLTCNPGEITIYPQGGTAPYIYQVSTIPGFQSTPQFEITTSGNYTVTVTDFNNCTATTNITVNQIPPPVFTMNQTNVLCYGNTTGVITFNVTNSNGYTLLYSIDNGISFSSNPVFSNLAAGTYQTLIQYSIGGVNCLTTNQIITITQPATALTASGGVSQLAGCGPAGEGQVRITNPQGGVAPYQYSFNNGVTYGTANTAFLPPGTYTLYIRDANLCVFPMTVTIDPAPNPPTIVVSNPAFNCNGTATSTVTVNNNGGTFAYTYLLDGVPNTNVPPNVFPNVACGNHTVQVQYQNLNIPSYSNLLNEDFGIGTNTTNPGIAAAYCFNNQPYAPGRPCGNLGANLGLPLSSCGSRTLEDNQYVVTSAINPNNCSWFAYRDHTSNGSNPNGRFLAVNIGSAAGPNGILYSKPINNVLPNQPVIIDIWLANLINAGAAGADPSFILELVNGSGTVVASQNTGIIDNTVNNWQLRSVTLNPGANTSLTFNVRSGSILYSGNDAAIDDIRVYQLPISCVTQANFPITIACGQAFTSSITSFSNVTCNGANNGQITISAQNFALPYGFDYSLNGGSTWINSTVSPVTVTGLGANTYNIVVRYNASASTCSFPFTQVISQPTALVATASLTSPATCLNGGTITASASGGTPNYQYQLVNTAGPTIVVAYQSNPVFSNLPPGNYIVNVRDANNCIDPINTPINIPTPVAPTATISSTSDLCYDGTNAATIVVNASGGVPSYVYSLNGGVFQSSNTFSGLTPGSYTVTVRDSYGCLVSIPAVTIAPQLLANVSLTSNFNCTTSPNAIITGTVSGGNAPYTYQVSYNSGPLSSSVSITGTTFTYSAASAGTYQFTIRDAIGCTFVTSTVTVVPLPVLLAPSVTQGNQILCSGDSNASIIVTPSGGLSPYVINVFNNTTSVNYGTQTSGLTAGNYTITVTDANSCTSTATIIINQPAPLFFTSTSTNIQCDVVAGTLPGTVDIAPPTGGTLPFTYTVSNSTGTFTQTHNAPTGGAYSFSILNFGIYTVTVVDANGCQYVTSNTIASPPTSLVITPTIVGVDCTTGGTVQVCVNTAVVGGPYFFAIYQDLSPAVPAYPTYPSLAYQPADVSGICSTFSGLTPGVTYSFIVYDQGTNCYYFQTASAPVPTLSSMTVTAPVVSNVTCTGASDGNVSVTVSNYSGTSISYQIFTSLNNNPVSPIGTATGLTGAPVVISNFGLLGPGQYYVLITETNGPNVGCSVTSANFTISESPVLLSLTASVTKNDNCNTNAGQITVVGSNGTGPYQYQLVPAGGLAPTVTTWAGQTSSVFNVEGGNYDVYIKDAYNCIQMVSIFVPTDSSPLITLAQVSTTVCNATEGNYQITVTRDNSVGIAPFTYSVDGSAFTTYTEDASFSFTLSGLNSGSHTVIIRDVNGCTFSQSITILPPVTSTAVATINTTPNCGVSDGIITVSAAGGSGSYSYSISPNPAVITQSGNVFSNVPANNYVVTVTDVITLCTTTVPVSIQNPSPVLFTSTATDATCFSGSDGSIVVNLDVSNTDPIYTYQITAPIVVGPQTSNVFSGLAANNYTVVVTSARGCSDTQIIPVGEPAVVSFPAPVVSQFTCNSGTNNTNFATITVNGVTGGSGTYITYDFILGGTVVQSGGSNVYTESNLAGGTYTINVYDNNGCIGTNSAVIDPFVSISNPVVTVVTPITCTSNESISVAVTVTGGTPPPFTYTVLGLGGNPYNVSQSTPNFTGLTIGNYLVSVENTVTGCRVETIHYVFDSNTFDTSISVLNNVSCFNGSNGSVTVSFIDNDVTPADEAGPFTYSVLNASSVVVASGSSPNAGPFPISGLQAGIYQLQATLVNSPFCTVIKNFSITQPSAALSIAATSTPITCIATSDDGTISVSAQDGWGSPYEYQLENGATIVSAWSASLTTFTGLGVGNYTVRVRDIEGCDTFTTVTLTTPTPIIGSISATPTNLLCFGDTTASITVSAVSGGQGSNYLYSLVNVTTGTTSAPQNTATFSNLGAGTYHVIITDAFNCTLTTSDVVITQPNNVVVAQLNTTSTATCNTNATITLSASGGTAPYQYSTTTGGPYSPLGTSLTFNVTPGTYQYYVIDANNCIEVVSNTIIVEPVIPVAITVDTTNAVISCNGGTTTITAQATNGLGNFIYTLLPATAGVVQNTPGVFENVPAGSYSVRVDSGDCFTSSASFTINQPTSITYTSSFANVICANDNNGSINVVASGGTGIIQYSISSNPLQTVNSGLFQNLAPGNYTVSVQDQAGCFLPPLTFTITEPTAASLLTYSFVEEACFNDGGSISFTVTGGTTTATQGYMVSVNNGAIVQSSLTGTFSFTNLPFGTYNFIVLDAANCDDLQFQQILNPGVDIQPQLDIDYLCTGNVPTNTVTVNVNSSLPLSDFTFSLDGNPAVASNVFNGVPTGNHIITVNHSNGCSEDVPFSIIGYTSPFLTLAETGLNQFTATTTGGGGGYQYELNGQNMGSTNVYLISATGNYTVTVTDANGCQDTKTIFMTFYDVSIPDYFTPDGDGNNDGWKPIFTDNFPNLKVYIFDRYSRKIRTLGQGDSWDGTYLNNPLPSGDYWYVLKLNGDSDAREFIGNFTLYR